MDRNGCPLSSECAGCPAFQFLRDVEPEVQLAGRSPIDGDVLAARLGRVGTVLKDSSGFSLVRHLPNRDRSIIPEQPFLSVGAANSRETDPREAAGTPLGGRDTGPPFAVSAPRISLPKGGGAIRGIGEKFGANPVQGIGSMSVPIAASPGRSGFGPQLALSYDAGSGNGVFGFGWSLAIPSIARKTEKGLPCYFDAEDSDVFVLSGAEDLVPVYRQADDGTWLRDAQGRLVIHEEAEDLGSHLNC